MMAEDSKAGASFLELQNSELEVLASIFGVRSRAPYIALAPVALFEFPMDTFRSKRMKYDSFQCFHFDPVSFSTSSHKQHFMARGLARAR